MSEVKFIPLKCPNCGGRLEISSDMERFSCGYCGSELIAERKGGTVSLKPLTDAIQRVQVGTDKTAAELALRRFQDELAEVTRHRQGRIKKQMAYGRQREEQWATRTSDQTGPLVLLGISIVFFGFVLFLGLSLTHNSSSSLVLVIALVMMVGFFVFIDGRRKRMETEILAKRMKEDEVEMAKYQHDIDAYDQHIGDLTTRIAEKKRIANA